MEFTRNDSKVRWEELLPDEFLERQEKCPIVFLPMGLCEPHGPIAAFGLDTIKAEYICNTAALQYGGIVAPTQNYHIHETGYHAPWLKEVVGDVNPRMGSLPPEILLQLFLYQLRAFSNAGFKGAIVITGHSGGNQEDLRHVASTFMEYFPMKIEVRADPELVAGKFQGDHAGKYEISQLMYIRPDLVDMTKINMQNDDKTLGRFALGHDASEATKELGMEIMQECVNEACGIARRLHFDVDKSIASDHISLEPISILWKIILSQKKYWVTNNLHPGQNQENTGSKWNIYKST